MVSKGFPLLTMLPNRSFKTRILDSLRYALAQIIGEESLSNLTRGHSATSWRGKIVRNHYSYPHNSIRHVERAGIRYDLDLHDMVQWYIYYGFLTLESLIDLAPKGGVILDVGANIGYATLRLAQKIGSQGHVHAFEPVPNTYRHLLRHLTLNPALASFISAHNIGLSAQRQELTFLELNVGNNGMNRVASELAEEVELIRNKVVIPSFPLDEWIKYNSINCLDLIKIDVEGYEYQVLMGAKNTIERFRPALFIELDDRNLARYGDDYRNLLRFLLDLDYRIQEADTGKGMNDKTKLENYHNDIIALPQ
jgi:FkbM family methyltransferase